MSAPDNKAIYAALLIATWIGLDFLNIKDAALVETLRAGLFGLGIFQTTMTKPGE